ncbi:MAG: hypothetical protein JJU12_06695 [Chlamydiales bacterium]|nr:hypothetical protein [Chlamydiales bacterium]
MSAEFWIISISIAVVAIAFVALVIFLAVTLLSVRKTVADVDDKIQAFEPFFRIVSKTGDVVEKKAKRSLEHAAEMEEEMRKEALEQRDRILNTAVEVAQWTLVGVALWQKLRERK